MRIDPVRFAVVVDISQTFSTVFGFSFLFNEYFCVTNLCELENCVFVGMSSIKVDHYQQEGDTIFHHQMDSGGWDFLLDRLDGSPLPMLCPLSVGRTSERCCVCLVSSQRPD